MYDHQTDSLWVHASGRAEDGPMKGQRLKLVPSTVTTWEQWKKTYPATLVLPGPRSSLLMGSYRGILGSEQIGLSVVVRFKAKIYPFRALKQINVVNDAFNGQSLVVFYSPAEKTATAWVRKADGRVLTFEQLAGKDAAGNTLVRDKETGSLWGWMTGEAVQGRLKGSRLEQVQSHPILIDRFEAFYPGAPAYRPPDATPPGGSQAQDSAG